MNGDFPKLVGQHAKYEALSKVSLRFLITAVLQKPSSQNTLYDGDTAVPFRHAVKKLHLLPGSQHCMKWPDRDNVAG